MNIVLKVGYIGTNYCGFQKQRHTPNTIQGILERALAILCKEPIQIHGAGRTDKGVHSLGQMVQFKSTMDIVPENYVYILNNMLPSDIRVYKAYAVPDGFHVRYFPSLKSYAYKIDQHKVPSLTSIPFALHYPYPLNIKVMKEALNTLIGTRDFTAFASRYSEVENRIRTIAEVRLEEKDDMLIFTIVGNGFLHNMVRIIVGTLLEVGRGTKDPQVFQKAYEHKDRKQLGKTATAKGLTLMAISYEEEYIHD